MVITVTVPTLDDLFPHRAIVSSTEPFDYAIMTPDYKWHYYAEYDTEHGRRFRPVTVTGEVLDG